MIKSIISSAKIMNCKCCSRTLYKKEESNKASRALDGEEGIESIEPNLEVITSIIE
jgi:hypothetical protein